MDIKIIGKIRTEFKDKFGLPRQSGIVKGLAGKIIMEKEFRRAEAFKELEGFSHIWLLWYADRANRVSADNPGSEKNMEQRISASYEWTPTVRPPRLGGNKHVGVFASRSPFRPNSIGLSVVKLIKIDYEDAEGPVLYVDGIDMLDGTPIIDIKPYIKASDCIEDAVCGYADYTAQEETIVIVSKDVVKQIPEDKRDVIIGILKEDPTPRYINDAERCFGFNYGGLEIKFKKQGHTITVLSVEEKQ